MSGMDCEKSQQAYEKAINGLGRAKRVTSDGTTSEQHPVADQIRAANYLKNQCCDPRTQNHFNLKVFRTGGAV